MGLVLILVGGVPITFGAYYTWKMKEMRIMSKIRPGSSEEEVLGFVIECINLLHEKHNPTNMLKLEGAYEQYLERIPMDSSREVIELDENVSENDEDKLENKYFSKGKDIFERNYYRFLVEIMSKFGQKAKNVQIKILIAYIYHYKLSNKWKAIYSMQEIQLMKPSMVEEAAILRYQPLTKTDNCDREQNDREEEALEGRRPVRHLEVL